MIGETSILLHFIVAGHIHHNRHESAAIVAKA
jgi:hypothetical protein